MEAGTGIGARPSSRRAASGVAVVLAAAGLTGIAAGVGLHFVLHGSTPAATAARHPGPGLRGEATWAPGARPAPPIGLLRDQSGRSFSLNSVRGRTVVIGFFDSHCTQACPLEGRALAAAERSLPRAQRPVLVAVSVNPLDTPASTRAAVRRWGLATAGAWHWLRGTHAALAAVWRAYHIFVARTKNDIVHTDAVYLVDRRGDERSAYLYPFLPTSVSADLLLLAGSPGGARG